MMNAEVVEIDTLHFHPLNPNIGNVDVIAESLEVNGQYKPVTVQRSTRNIVAGNHRVKAAKLLGWTRIAVNFIDVSDEEALEILLADNKASDESVTDEQAAFNLLATLPSVVGTGYTVEDLELPEPVIDIEEPESQPASEKPEKEDQEDKPVPFQIGGAKGYLQAAAFKEWRAGLPRPKEEAFEVVALRLGMAEVQRTAQTANVSCDVEAVLISDLLNYPGNPQQGDIGTIMGLLEKHGQYSPVVVNKRNNRILAGNHVVLAASQLGWERIGVSWVDVDADAEKRIVLVDNRARALARYDLEALSRAVMMVDPSNIEAAGFTFEDLDTVAQGQELRPRNGRRAEATIVVGNIRGKVRIALVRAANLTAGQELIEAAAMLGINPAFVVTID